MLSINKDGGRWHGANSLRGERALSSLAAQWSTRQCTAAVLKYSTSDLGHSETLDTPTEMLSQLKGYQPFACGCLLLCPLLFLCTNIHFITFGWIEFHGRGFWAWRTSHVTHFLSVFKHFYTLANTKQHEQHWYEIINIPKIKEQKFNIPISWRRRLKRNSSMCKEQDIYLF